ncbi:MAG: hypothetical protein HRT37_21280 [Alteromonadaceae bacterium]|nr:hypothetical protein [Alteromonadaceae bacterium]
MSAIWNHHALHLVDFMNGNNEAQARMYIEQLMLFPTHIQDRIFEDISHLSHCSSEAVATIINKYSMIDIQ